MAAFLNFSPSGRDQSEGTGGGNPFFRSLLSGYACAFACRGPQILDGISKKAWDTHDFKVKMLDWTAAPVWRTPAATAAADFAILQFSIRARGPWMARAGIGKYGQRSLAWGTVPRLLTSPMTMTASGCPGLLRYQKERSGRPVCTQKPKPARPSSKRSPA